MGDLRLTEFDQILVCGSWVEATDVKVGFTQLLSPDAAVTAAVADGGGVAIVVAVGAWRSHLMIGQGHICLLWKNKKALLGTRNWVYTMIWWLFEELIQHIS